MKEIRVVCCETSDSIDQSFLQPLGIMQLDKSILHYRSRFDAVNAVPLTNGDTLSVLAAVCSNPWVR
jgi:hypothetical protein